jgi:hypothetical protein
MQTKPVSISKNPGLDINIVDFSNARCLSFNRRIRERMRHDTVHPRGSPRPFAGDIDPLVGKIGNSWRKFEAQHVAEREDLVGEPGGVGVVLFDAQLGFVIQKAIEHMGRVADIGVDHLGVERRVLIGQMGIEQDAGLAAVFGVAVAAGRTRRPIGPEQLLQPI